MNRFRKLLGEGSELHRQIYHSWREYREAMLHTLFLGFAIGCMTMVTVFMIAGK